MNDLRVAAAQFESRSADKDFNLERINDLSARAAAAGADVMAFHECSITGYSFARRLSKAALLEIAEQVPRRAKRRASHSDLPEERDCDPCRPFRAGG
jgi:predicted amidohydrolase